MRLRAAVPARAMVHGVGRRKGVEVKSGAVAGRAAVQSWSCGGDDARGDSADDDGGDPPTMGGAGAEAAIVGPVRDRCGNQDVRAEASESERVVAVVVAV